MEIYMQDKCDFFCLVNKKSTYIFAFNLMAGLVQSQPNVLVILYIHNFESTYEYITNNYRIKSDSLKTKS